MHQSDSNQGLPHKAEELQDAPQLQALRDQLGGGIPEGYFENFNRHLADRMQDADALADAPMLRAIGRNVKPQVPEGYFESFYENLLPKLPSHKTSIRKLWQRPTVWAIAAGIVVLLSVFPLLNTNTQSSPDQLLADLSEQELLALADYADTDAEDVAAIYSIEDVLLDDLESIDDSDAEALLESLDLSEMDIMDLLEENEL